MSAEAKPVEPPYPTDEELDQLVHVERLIRGVEEVWDYYRWGVVGVVVTMALLQPSLDFAVGAAVGLAASALAIWRGGRPR